MLLTKITIVRNVRFHTDFSLLQISPSKKLPISNLSAIEMTLNKISEL